MTDPTPAALRAAQALCEHIPGVRDDAQLVASVIDDAAGLPTLLAERDALLAACRAFAAWDNFGSWDIGVPPNLDDCLKAAKAAIALCDKETTDAR